jgi:hypothetical protein
MSSKVQNVAGRSRPGTQERRPGWCAGRLSLLVGCRYSVGIGYGSSLTRSVLGGATGPNAAK